MMDDPAWDAFFEDLERCSRGLDPNGEKLFVDEFGDDWGPILLFSLGDLEQFTVGYGMRGYNDRDEMCGWCRANRTTRLFTDNQEDSAWRPTEDMPNDVKHPSFLKQSTSMNSNLVLLHACAHVEQCGQIKLAKEHDDLTRPSTTRVFHLV